MAKHLKALALTMTAILFVATAWGATQFNSEKDRRSYAIGANVGKNIKQQGVAVDPALVARGVVDELAGKSLLSDEDLGKIMQQLQGEVRQKLLEQHAADAARNKQRGEAYLAENSKKAGVSTLPGGVQYQVLRQGEGRLPTDQDTVLCNYRGMLIDGKVFDASKPDTPAPFKLGQLIPGWREALKKMPVGSKWQLVIPPAQAYGERGAGNLIGPSETLVFEVELVGIQ